MIFDNLTEEQKSKVIGYEHSNHIGSTLLIDRNIDLSNEKYDVLFASYSLVAEGLDIPQLENLIMATPIKDKRLVVQSIGRCQRPYEGKKIANIYDLIDDVSILYKFTSSRKSIYKQEGWEII